MLCLAISLDLGDVDGETARTAVALFRSQMSIDLHSNEHDDKFSFGHIRLLRFSHAPRCVDTLGLLFLSLPNGSRVA